MKTSLKFLDAATGKPSDCGAPLEIEMSSAELGWQGVLVEEGWSPYFHPTDVVTPYFYFALAREAPLHGYVLLRDRQMELEMEPGEIWMNPPGSPFTHRIDVPCFFVILAVDPARLFAAYKGSRNPERAEFLNDYNVDDVFLSHLVELFQREAARRGRGDSPLFEHLLGAFASYFVDSYSAEGGEESAIAPPGRELTDEAIATVRRYVIDRGAEPILVEELADQLKMSKFWFLKSFKRTTGLSPYRYVLEVKVDEARRMLTATRRSLVDIALHLGFSDQSHFSRVFKRLTGSTPGQYRTQRNAG